MTDYKAEALDFLNIAYENESQPHEVVCAHVSAQVHATLALAEQQKIANLIALLQLDAGDIHDFGKQGVIWSQVTLAIREGLGL